MFVSDYMKTDYDEYSSGVNNGSSGGTTYSYNDS